jgi:hypothetical protein
MIIQLMATIIYPSRFRDVLILLGKGKKEGATNSEANHHAEPDQRNLVTTTVIKGKSDTGQHQDTQGASSAPHYF